MRVVVTRPESSARRTDERLQNLGHQPVLLPLTKSIHHPDAAATALAGRHSALAVTSAEAVRVLSSLGDRLAPFLGQTLYAVGETTAKAAEDTGFRDIRRGPGTGAELAELIASDASDFDAPLLYLAGKPRSPQFEDGLNAEGVPFVATEVYGMMPIAYDEVFIRATLLDPPVDAVLLYSRENARLFCDFAAPHLKELASVQFLCLSDNVAENIPREFHRNIKIASHPDEDGVLALL
ncbi:uroporphyrinogen-III synthase [Neorhizobium galegae]|uniref:Uroporphyrinogen-III synthase n=1 Tax=Neorhizobium galegae bv. orientalis str. HAMBI 540 TaxID=1028800 RepID=A0A068SXM9_NEOGA|nr:uroporphyrinogen-III synthase [Neorhizobium galegae]CDN49845.1 Uroporphyrinogen III synthase HEM4 [Neorhizobium galegae bv. orientalis str. HAMBI 540]CDZ50127.1 Uroporphyrinogen III synthase HEM4 [Neorhizobium galegae bv. orientalis]